MNKIKYIISAFSFLGLASCSVEAPFQGEETGMGQFSKKALELNVASVNKVTTKASNEDYIPNFDIEFHKNGSDTPIKYKYSEMPEIVPLSAGTYTIKAIHGDNKPAAFEEPHFKGESEQFVIKENEITTSVGTIKCQLQNIKVTVVFHSSLTSHMDDDAYVEVKVKEDGETLKFYKSHAENETAGYFKHDGECTLIATFKGKIDGVQMNEEVKTLGTVSGGNHYKLTFQRHDYEGEESGSLDPNISIDTNVTVSDVNSENPFIEDDKTLDDNERPKEDDPSSGDDDQNNNDPGTEEPNYPPTNTPSSEGPIINLDPTSTVQLEEVCDVDEESVVILNIHSESGINKFLVKIESDELTGLIGGDGTLNLVDPGEMLGFLKGVHILPDGKETLEGETDVTFDITGFMPMLILVEGTHKFVITVGDADGDKTVNLILNVPIKD